MRPNTADRNLLGTTQNHSLQIRLAQPHERPAIYALRHAIYAEELHQYSANERSVLQDELDEANDYLVAMVGQSLAGFISLTPPTAPKFSVEKHLRLEELPLQRGPKLFEARLLTVRPEFRGTLVATALMYAALRWVENRGGEQIIGIGRHEVLPIYRKVGFQMLGREVRSGAVTYHLMMATVDQLRTKLNPSWLARAEREVDWALPCPFRPLAPCFHGGAFFQAVGEDFTDLNRHHQIINADVLDAWFPPAPEVLEALHTHLPWLARTSPPTDCSGLLRVIADKRGVAPDQLLPGGGSSDLIFTALRFWLKPTSRVLLLNPTYGEYAHVLEKVIGCRVDRFHLHPEVNYDWSPAELLKTLDRNYDLVVLVNPNSPTGRHVPGAELEFMLERAPSHTKFWIDETYLEYVGSQQSLEPWAAASPNVIVCKSMSKVYALSGLRAAYLCGPEPIIAELRAINPPWAVSLPAQVAAVRALQSPRYYEERLAETRLLREELHAGLEELGFAVVPGVANFLLGHLPHGDLTAGQLVARCRRHGLFLRDVSNMGVTGNAIRIAVKDRPTNHRMLSILRQEIQPSS